MTKFVKLGENADNSDLHSNHDNHFGFLFIVETFADSSGGLVEEPRAGALSSIPGKDVHTIHTAHHIGCWSTTSLRHQYYHFIRNIYFQPTLASICHLRLGPHCKHSIFGYTWSVLNWSILNIYLKDGIVPPLKKPQTTTFKALLQEVIMRCSWVPQPPSLMGTS